MVASGEAIRVGDRRVDSMKKASSLRIRAGQMFGVEEVRMYAETGELGLGLYVQDVTITTVQLKPFVVTATFSCHWTAAV